MPVSFNYMWIETHLYLNIKNFAFVKYKNIYEQLNGSDWQYKPLLHYIGT